MDDVGARNRIERLRASRVRPMPDRSIRNPIDAMLRSLRQSQRRFAGVAEAWQAWCPPELLDRTMLSAVNRGVVVVRVPDAGTRFRLDRALRAGGLRDLQRRSRSAIRTVRIDLGDIASREDGEQRA